MVWEKTLRTRNKMIRAGLKQHNLGDRVKDGRESVSKDSLCKKFFLKFLIIVMWVKFKIRGDCEIAY